MWRHCAQPTARRKLGGPDKATLPRDTVFAAVMIICTGVVGLCLLVGGLSHHEQTFRLEGASSALAALVALTGLTLVLPTFTTSSPEGTYTLSQLVFAAVSSLALWGVFVFVQTVRHRDYFLPQKNAADEEEEGGNQKSVSGGSCSRDSDGPPRRPAPLARLD